MISGHIDAAQELSILPPVLQKAVRFLQNNDLAAHEPGRFEIDLDGVPVVLQVLDLQTAPRETLRPEVHRTNVDVQFLAAGGPERAVWYPDLGGEIVEENLLDTPRDILFYRNRPADAAKENVLELSVGSYAMYFPWDVHVPAVQVGENSAYIRKIVLKVPLQTCMTNAAGK